MTDEERHFYLLAHAALKRRGKEMDKLLDMAFDGVDVEFAHESIKAMIRENQKALQFFFEKASKK